MDEKDALAERFEAHRGRLRAVAYRMLGSPAEADDAVQEAGLRLSRTDPGGIDDLESWLRTVVSRLCLDRTPVATKKLASRARHRVRGVTNAPGTRAHQRRVVEAFLAATRSGDLDALLAVLAPDVVRRADRAALTPGRETVVRGAEAVAREMQAFGRRSSEAEPALVDGAVGIVVAPYGRLLLVLAITVEDDRVAAYEVIADSVRLHRLDLAVLDG